VLAACLLATNIDQSSAFGNGKRKLLQEAEISELTAETLSLENSQVESVGTPAEGVGNLVTDELSTVQSTEPQVPQVTDISTEMSVPDESVPVIPSVKSDSVLTVRKGQFFDEDDDDQGDDILEDEDGISPESGSSDLGFVSAFIRSFLVIVVIEVGDRTFFIAALLGIKYNQLIVFIGAFGALAFMTVVSTVLGVAAPMLLPRWFTHYAAFGLFGFFGCQLLHKSYYMKHGVSEELEEVEEELDSKKGVPNVGANTPIWKKFVNPVLVQAFTMTALAEWGDRSQIATIALAADYNPYGITIGGSLGHGVATAGAVLGGRYLATKISEKTITTLGGITFLTFAILAFFEDPNEDIGKSIPSWMTDWS